MKLSLLGVLAAASLVVQAVPIRIITVTTTPSDIESFPEAHVLDRLRRPSFGGFRERPITGSRPPCHGGKTREASWLADLLSGQTKHHPDHEDGGWRSRLPALVRPGRKEEETSLVRIASSVPAATGPAPSLRETFSARLEASLDELEQTEAIGLSFVFGLGLGSLFGILFKIVRLLVLRKRARMAGVGKGRRCCRRRQQREQEEQQPIVDEKQPAPPAYEDENVSPVVQETPVALTAAAPQQ